MNAELGTQLRVAGLVRSPDHEGALAHLDLDRGFALVARGAASLSDVVDPTIWVKEKLSVALVAGSDPSETPLGRIITALRSIHAELVRRPARDRPWVSVLAAVFHAGDGFVVSAGDCACFRFRDGLLSRLERPGDAPGLIPPRGALGSEQQVRLDVVPLRPRPGDLYVASTRQLREGELAALARDLASARDGAELLRAGVEGSSDRGRFTVRVLEGEEDAASLPARAESLLRAPSAAEAAPEATAGEPPRLEITPLIPETALVDAGDPVEETTAAATAGAYAAASEPPVAPAIEEDEEERLGAPKFLLDPDAISDELAPPGVPGALRSAPVAEDEGAVAIPAAEALEAGPMETESVEAADAAPPPPRRLAQIEDAPPWYEPIALWVGGALAIIALALLVRAIYPGLTGGREKGTPLPPAVAAKGVVDFFSDPDGAAVRVDGEWLDGRTPLAGVELETGTHRVELDWGPAGTWRDTIRVTGGERLAVHPAIYGTMALRASDPARTLDVYLDGSFAGTTPLRLDHVVVGRHLVRFGGPGAAGTTQQIDVLRDAPVEVIGSAGPAPTTGKLTIRSALLTDGGFEPGKGDPVWVDGVVRGVTPLSVSLKPGDHSVRVVRRNFPAQVTVIDVKAGGDHYVTAEFGARSEQPLQLAPPEGISISSPLPVTVTIPEDAWDPSVSVWLYAASPEGAFQAKRMTKLDGGDRVFAAVVPAEVAQNGDHRVRIYCKASGTDGRELFTEIVTLPVRP
ncbi:MAG TPA: PEGA domain-containing protein [Candidatus Omnitrophota bacterium]|nr:PEGA domain-containing protein [Candidatus Omnitrophota bacterium]